MRKYKSVEFQFDPEIEKTIRRLRREHRELQTAIAMDDLQDLRNLNRREEIQPVNVHEDLNGQCVQRHRELQTTVAIDDLQDLRNLNRIEEIQPVNVHEDLNGQCVQRQSGNTNIFIWRTIEIGPFETTQY